MQTSKHLRVFTVLRIWLLSRDLAWKQIIVVDRPDWSLLANWFLAHAACTQVTTVLAACCGIFVSSHQLLGFDVHAGNRHCIFTCNIVDPDLFTPDQALIPDVKGLRNQVKVVPIKPQWEDIYKLVVCIQVPSASALGSYRRRRPIGSYQGTGMDCTSCVSASR